MATTKSNYQGIIMLGLRLFYAVELRFLPTFSSPMSSMTPRSNDDYVPVHTLYDPNEILSTSIQRLKISGQISRSSLNVLTDT